MSKLFTSLSIKSIRFKNRIAISPMCQYSAKDGFANAWHLVHLGSRAIGGAGLIMQEATAVSEHGRISYGDAGIYNDAHIEKWKEITTFIHDNGAIAGIQLAHAGRKASCELPWNGGNHMSPKQGGWETIAPSSLPFINGNSLPKALNEVEIKKVIAEFKEAALRSLHAGYKVIELHAAHGYLINEFLSPLSNHRTDSYGGSFENRTRLLLEIVGAVKEVWPEEFPLFVRLSITDWVEGGWNELESIKLATILKASGVDLIDCSSGGLVPSAKIPIGPGYQVPFAEHLKIETGILTATVGLITEANQAETILEQGQADLVFLGRESLRDPYFPMHAAQLLGDDTEWPLQYVRAK